MANKETRVLKQDTLEVLRQKTNEISLHVGDNEQLDALLADKTYNYTASAGQVLFDGADNNSKVTRFELSPQHTIDNTGGSIILEGVSSLDASYIAGANIYQGSSGSETWQAVIVSASVNKIIVRDSSGTFSSSADLKVGTSSPDTIANAKIARIIIESYPVAIARVYNNNTELTQGMFANGFFAPKIVGVSSITGSPSVGNAFSEGVTVYQNGTALNTQGDIESSSNWYGVLHSVDSDEIRFKTSQGSFSATAKLRVLGSSDEIAAANHGALTAVDSTYGSYIELTTPAANTNVIKVFSLDLVAAINELQDDIGTVENLTTSASDVVLAINEHDSELGTITAAAMATTASTVSGAIREHEDQIGNVDITGIASGNNTITGALEQIHNEIGDVTSGNLGTSASNLTDAVKEHEDQIGNENINAIDSGSNTITGALNQLHTEVGSLSLNTSASDLTAAINEHEGDIGNMSLDGLTATDLSAAIRELRVELGNHLEIDDATGYSATTAVGGIKEIQGDIGDVDDLDTNAVSDLVAAINELENVLRDDTTQRTGYVMGTNANNVVAAINEFETVLRGTNSNYTLNTAASNVRDAINEHESNIGNMIFGSGGPVDVVDPNNISQAIRILDAEVGDTSYTGADITTAIKDIQDDINTAGSLTTLNTTNKFIVGAINETDADLFNAAGSADRRTMNDLSTADKSSIVDAINEIYADIHTSGSVTLDTEASHLVGAINEIEAVFDASAKNITAGSNTFSITSGAFTINSSANINLDTGNNHIVLKDDGDEFGRLSHNGGQLDLKSGANQLFLSANNTNATFANNLTVTNDLIVNNDVDIEGNVDVNGSIETDGLSINGTTITATATELNIMDGGTTIQNGTLVDTDGIVINDNGTMKQFALSNFEPYFEDALDTLPNVTTVGTLNAGSITSGFGSIDVGTSTIDGGIITGSQFRIGNAQIVEAELETIDGVVAGTVSASKAVVVDANKDITGFRNLTLSGELDVATLDISGNVDTDGTLDVLLGSTLRGAVNITDTTASSSTTTGALKVAGGVGIGEDLYVAGDLYVEGDRVQLDTQTLTVEDTLVLAGNNLSSEPSSGGFGLEVGPITNPSGVASGVTGAHSIVYNYATDRWEADGSLILSQATLGSPNIEGQAFESGDNLDFTANNGVSVTTSKSGTTHTVLYQNTDRGSAQDIFKNIAINSVTIEASGNSDTVTFTDDDVVNVSGNAGTQTISLFHKNVLTDNSGTAGTFGQVNAQDGQYIKSLTLTAEGHVSAITTGDFDTRYEASNPAWNLKVSGSQIDPVANGNSVDFAVGQVDSTAGLTITSSTDGTDSVITLAHANTSSVTNLSSNNSGGTVLQDISLSFDTYGHTTARSIGTVNLDNRYMQHFTLHDGDGTQRTIERQKEVKFLEASGGGATIDINWTDTDSGSDADPYDLTFTVTNTDKGSSQNIFKNVQIQQPNGSIIYTNSADSNNDTLILREVQVSSTDGIALTNVADDIIGIAHANTSSASSSNNSGRTYIQDITIDTYGHVTGIGTATETYVYNHPTYPGDDYNVDTGSLTGATVVSRIDTNLSSDTIGSVEDANFAVETRNLTLGDLGFAGWDVEVNGTHVADIGNNGDVDFKNGNHTTAVWTASGNRIQWNHNTFTSGGTYTGGSNNGIVIEGFHIDSFGHIRDVQTRDLDSRFDNYNEWRIQADADSTTYGHVDTLEYVKFVGGNKINTTRSGNNITINLDTNHGFLTSQRTATLTAVNSGADGNDPILRLSDGGNSDVRITDSGSVTVTYTNSGAINIHGTDTNTDVDVSTTNLKTRLGQLSGTINIGDSTTSDNDIVIRGDLTVQGSTTTVNTETVTIQDNIIVLNSNSAGNPTENAGIEVERGNSANVLVRWNESSDRWQFTNNGSTYYNIPISSDYMNNFKVEVDDGGNVNITDNEILGLRGGTAINTDIVTTVSGENHTIEVKHSNVGRSDPAAGAVTLDYDDQFSAVTGVTSNSQGHVTAVNTTQFTMPSIYNLPLASSSTRGGVKIGYVENGKNYPVELASEKMYVNVPWTDTNTFRTIKVDTTNNATANATLGATEELHLIGGTNVTLSESGGVVTINSTDNNTVTRVKADGGTFQSGDITIAATGASSISQSGNTITISSTDNNTNTFRTVKVDTTNNGTANATLGATEALQLIGGSNVTLSESGGIVTINSTDTNTVYGKAQANVLGLIEVGYTTNNTNRNYAVALDGNDAYVNVPWTDTNTNTFLDDVSIQDNGANIILRHTMSDNTSHDIGITAGTGITLTEGTDTFEIASTTNLSFSRNSSSLEVTSSNGSNVTLPLADTNGPGLLSVGGHTLLSTIDTNANQNIAGTGISLTNNDKTINLASDQRLADDVDVRVGAGNTYAVFDHAGGPSGTDRISLYLDDSLDFDFYESGIFHARNDVIAFSTSVSSDINLKDNIQKVDGALELVSQLNGVTFDWKDKSKGSSAGVIAQNVEEVLPSAVKDFKSIDGDEVHKHVDYNQLSALFIEAIKELKEENKLLRAEIESLKDINS